MATIYNNCDTAEFVLDFYGQDPRWPWFREKITALKDLGVETIALNCGEGCEGGDHHHDDPIKMIDEDPEDFDDLVDSYPWDNIVEVTTEVILEGEQNEDGEVEVILARCEANVEDIEVTWEIDLTNGETSQRLVKMMPKIQQALEKCVDWQLLTGTKTLDECTAEGM